MSISIQTLPQTRFSIRVLLAVVAAALTLGLATEQRAHAEPAPKQPAVSVEKAAAAKTTSGVVNLNSASEEELMRLPGIGPAKARAILELRGKLGRFSRLEDVLRVKGIGRKTFRDLEPMLRLDGPTTLAAQQPARAVGKKAQ